jgi:hypothetical protein
MKCDQCRWRTGRWLLRSGFQHISRAGNGGVCLPALPPATVMPGASAVRTDSAWIRREATGHGDLRKEHVHPAHHPHRQRHARGGLSSRYTSGVVPVCCGVGMWLMR